MNKATEKKHLKYWITANTFDRGDITKSFETIEECDEWMYEDFYKEYPTSRVYMWFSNYF